MTDLERRALLGDRHAQEECTQQGIVLRCGCDAPAKLGYVERDPDADFDPCHGYIVKCQKCDMNSWYHKTPQEAVAVWNNRAAQQLGKCKDCANTTPGEDLLNHKDVIVCTVYGCRVKEDGLCREFEPKGEKDRDTHRD